MSIKTYCDKQCSNNECSHKLTQKVWDKEKKLQCTLSPLIASTDLSEDCKDFKELDITPINLSSFASAVLHDTNNKQSIIRAF